jgi:hypothetical protein
MTCRISSLQAWPFSEVRPRGVPPSPGRAIQPPRNQRHIAHNDASDQPDRTGLLQPSLPLRPRVRLGFAPDDCYGGSVHWNRVLGAVVGLSSLGLVVACDAHTSASATHRDNRSPAAHSTSTPSAVTSTPGAGAGPVSSKPPTDICAISTGQILSGQLGFQFAFPKGTTNPDEGAKLSCQFGSAQDPDNDKVVTMVLFEGSRWGEVTSPEVAAAYSPLGNTPTPIPGGNGEWVQALHNNTLTIGYGLLSGDGWQARVVLEPPFGASGALASRPAAMRSTLKTILDDLAAQTK